MCADMMMGLNHYLGRDGQIVFRTTRPLPAYNGLTVAAAWAKGIVAPPTAGQQAGWWFTENLPGVVAGAGLSLLLGFYGLAWAKVGRDPPRGTIIPEFGPPQNMSAAAVRFVRRMGFDDRAFTAAIIDLGVAGHVKLTGDGRETVIESRDGGKPIGAPEQALESSLFATRPSLKLVQTNYEALGKAKSALKDRLAQAYDGTLFTDNYGWSGLGLVLTVLLLAAAVIAVITTYDSDTAGVLIIGMLMPAIPIVIGAFLLRTGLRRDSWGGVLIAIGLVLIAAGVFSGFAVILAYQHGPMDLGLGLAAYVAAPLALLGFHWLQAPTAPGRAVMDHIEGFRMYLGVAEEDRLNALNPPDKTPELFERFLPYAIALDVENRWAKRFAGVLAAAGTSAAVGTWYAGSRDWRNDPVGFANHLGGSLANTIASASSPPGARPVVAAAPMVVAPRAAAAAVAAGEAGGKLASGACRLFDTQTRQLIERMVDRQPTGTPSHDGERHGGPGDVDRPAIRHGKLDDASHEQKT
jgi:hypothetical protein